MTWLPDQQQFDGRKLGLELRRLVAALFGLDDPLRPGPAVSAEVDVVRDPPAAAPPAPEEE